MPAVRVTRRGKMHRRTALHLAGLSLSVSTALGCQRAKEDLEVDVAVSRERVLVTLRAEDDCWPTSGWAPLDSCQSHVHELNRPGCRPTKTCATAAQLVQDGNVLARSEEHPFELVVEDGWTGKAFVELEGCDEARPIEVEVLPDPAAQVQAVIQSSSPYALDVGWAGDATTGSSAFTRTEVVINPLPPGSVFQGHCHVPGSVATGLLPEREPDALRRVSITSFLVGQPSTTQGGLGTYRVWPGESWSAELFVPPPAAEERWSLQRGVTTVNLGEVRYLVADTLAAFSYSGDEPLLEISGALVGEDGQLFNEHLAFSLQAGAEADEIRVRHGAEWFVASPAHVSARAAFESPTASSVHLDYGELTLESTESERTLPLSVRVQIDSFPIAQVQRP